MAEGEEILNNLLDRALKDEDHETEALAFVLTYDPIARGMIINKWLKRNQDNLAIGLEWKTIKTQFSFKSGKRIDLIFESEKEKEKLVVEVKPINKSPHSQSEDNINHYLEELKEFPDDYIGLGLLYSANYPFIKEGFNQHESYLGELTWDNIASILTMRLNDHSRDQLFPNEEVVYWSKKIIEKVVQGGGNVEELYPLTAEDGLTLVRHHEVLEKVKNLLDQTVGTLQKKDPLNKFQIKNSKSNLGQYQHAPTRMGLFMAHKEHPDLIMFMGIGYRKSAYGVALLYFFIETSISDPPSDKRVRLQEIAEKMQQDDPSLKDKGWKFNTGKNEKDDRYQIIWRVIPSIPTISDNSFEKQVKKMKQWYADCISTVQKYNVIEIATKMD
ncbi:MAG: hypothetical protein P9L92_00595 [Candidatus Electryonea clarkiae]|nr:hypothetical protein [Candidatus Electryonea clarkiae]MDP8287077.1 hypothetical protein [Candidatus Electryonea clarkiae]